MRFVHLIQFLCPTAAAYLFFCELIARAYEKNCYKSVCIYYKRTDRYAPCPLDFCHIIGLRPPFSTLQASTWPVASIFVPSGLNSACGLNFRSCGLNSIHVPQQHYGRSSRVLNSGRLGVNTPPKFKPVYDQIFKSWTSRRPNQAIFSCLSLNSKLRIDVRICIRMFL